MRLPPLQVRKLDAVNQMWLTAGCRQELMSGEAAKERATPFRPNPNYLRIFRFGDEEEGIFKQ